jgi:uncharacterized protein (TIRG00374 family)
VLVLLYVLTRKGLISLDATRRAFAHWEIAPAIAALVVAMLVGTARWHWLLRGRGIHLRPTRTLALALVGNFFSLALPGAVSGDVVKGFYVAKTRPDRRHDIFATILLDRVTGLSALVVLAAAAFLMMEFDAVRASTLLGATQVLIVSAAAVVIVFYGHLFLVREHHDPLLGLLRALERRAPRAGSLTRVYRALRHYHDQPRAVVRAVAASLVIHCLVCFAFWNLWQALEPVDVPMLSLVVVVPLGLLVTAVPIAPAGMGTGHAAFGWLFLLLGSRMGANVFNLFAVLQLGLAGVGGIVYLRLQANESLRARDELAVRET